MHPMCYDVFTPIPSAPVPALYPYNFMCPNLLINPLSPLSAGIICMCMWPFAGAWEPLRGWVIWKPDFSPRKHQLSIVPQVEVRPLAYLHLPCWDFVWLDLAHIVTTCEFTCTNALLHPRNSWSEPIVLGKRVRQLALKIKVRVVLSEIRTVTKPGVPIFCQGLPGICNQDCRCIPPCLYLMWVLGIQTQIA